MAADALTLSPHQHMAVERGQTCLSSYAYFLLVMTMRAGKTIAVLSLIEQREYARVLVTAPPNVISVWKKEIEKFFPQLRDKISIVSHHLFARKTTKEKFDCLVIDEIHNFRASSKRTETILQVAKNCRHKIGLTGTVCNRSALELYFPLKIMQRKDKNQPLYNTNAIQRWRAKWGFCPDPHSPFPTWQINPFAEEVFFTELRKISYISDPGHIARPELKKVFYNLTEKQRYLYNAILKRKSFVWDNKPWQFEEALGGAHINNKLRQICSGFLYIDDSTLQVMTKKYIAMFETIKKTSGTILIWYNYAEEKAKVLYLLTFLGKVLEFKRGMTAEKIKQEAPRFVVCHPKSAGAGLDLSFASASIYLGVSDDYINLKQSEFRTADQLGTVKINYFLTARYSVEESRFQTLALKEREYQKIYAKGGHIDETIYADCDQGGQEHS